MDETAKKYAAEIGYNIKHFRQEKNISQQKLADLIKEQTTYKLIDQQNKARKKLITRDSIAKYESGTVLPPIDNIASIAKALEVNIWSLMPSKFKIAVNEAADNVTDLFGLMMNELNCLWSYDRSMEKVLIMCKDQNVKGYVTSADIVYLHNKTQDFYKSELIGLLKDMETANDGKQD